MSWTRSLDAGEQPLGPAGHVLRGHGLGRLGPHLVRLGHQGSGLLLRVGQLPPAAALVGLPLLQVGAPADVVDIEALPVRVEVEDPVDDLAEQVDVVGDDDQPALVDREVVPQPQDRVGIEVVGRLVEQQGLRPAEEDAGELDPASLAAGEGMQWLAEDALLQSEGGGDRGSLGLGGIAAGGVELGLEPRIPAHRPLHGLRVGAGHPLLCDEPVGDDPVQPAGAEDAVPGEVRRGRRCGVLGQVSDGAARGDRPAGGLTGSGEDLVNVFPARCGRPARLILRRDPGNLACSRSNCEPARSISVAVITMQGFFGRGMGTATVFGGFGHRRGWAMASLRAGATP